VAAALAERGGQLRDVLRRVGGRVEWGVKAYPAANEPERPGEDGGAGQGNRPADEGNGPRTEGGVGLAYLRRRRAQLTAARESKTAAATGARALHTELTAKATDTRLHPPQPVQLGGVRMPMLLNAAYLLDASAGVTFTAAVAGLATAHPELRVELTGPWPPYSFAGEDDDEH
jgi:hypothetical protein